MKIANKAETKKKRGNPNWKKGGPSPNPTGRPHDTLTPHLRQIAATGKGREVAERLFDEAVAGNVQAIGILLDRLDGKPRQGLDLTLDDGARERFESAVELLIERAQMSREDAIALLSAVKPEVSQWLN